VIAKEGIHLEIDGNVELYSYSRENKAQFFASNIRQVNGTYEFDLNTPDHGDIHIRLGIPGLINIENAVAASAASLTAGADAKELAAALDSFTGIKRRFDHISITEDLIYIDDYAHHPEEIIGLLNSVRHMYPGKKIVGVFQPHLYSRTRDHAEGFAKSLDQLDEVILLPIYPAREKPMPGIESEMILRLMNKTDGIVSEKKDLIKNLENREFDILLTIGAGDIDELVEPIKNFVESKKSQV
ncbi:MAG: UDP-N-acetylmuramate--L-alanine ligase, partial [Bacteroidales bacterium]|nr:UDP-N-acetylmuramate--L-alanine ligase [Bacteroidales bacterium]